LLACQFGNPFQQERQNADFHMRLNPARQPMSLAIFKVRDKKSFFRVAEETWRTQSDIEQSRREASIYESLKAVSLKNYYNCR
jgi:hypothetical protein